MISRREFIGSTAALFLSRPVWAVFTRPETALVAGSFAEHGASRTPAFVLLDLSGKARASVVLPEIPHSIVPNPRKPHLFVAMPMQESLFVVDIGKKASPRQIPVLKGNTSSGHGVFTPDGSMLFTTEVSGENAKGVVVLRSFPAMQVLKTFPTPFLIPHEIRLTDGGKTLAVSHAGRPHEKESAALCFLDAQTGAVKETYLCSDIEQRMLHFALGPDGTFVVSGSLPAERAQGVLDVLLGRSTKRQPKVLIGRRGDPRMTMLEPPLQNGGKVAFQPAYISAAVHPETGTGAVVDERQDAVGFFDLKQRKFLKQISIPAASGVDVSVDGKYFVVCGREKGLFAIEAHTLELDQKNPLPRPASIADI